MTTYVHVNRNVIFANGKHGRNDPPVRIQKGKYGKPTYCYEVELTGPSKVIYSAHEPLLPCGAKLIIATEAEVKVVK